MGPREDRVVVGGYGEIVAMGASQRMIFVASPSGLATYDRVAQRWLPPLTEADGYPAGRITALAGDPELEGVWIAALGEVLFYRPAIDQLIRTIVGGRTERILFDRDDPGVGAYVGAGDQWTRVSSGGFGFPVTLSDLPPQGRRVESPSLESLSEEMPALRSFSDLLTRDEALRSWRPTSAAQVTGMSEVWLGTLGGGIYLADPLFNRARHIPFGLFEPGASALALASDGVWAASLGAELRGTGGVTFAGSDLQEWRWLRGPADGSLAALPTYDALVRDGVVWVANDRGVARRDTREGSSGRPSEWSWVSGGRMRRAYSLAVLGGTVWAGTDGGVLAIGSAAADGSITLPTEAAIGAVRPAGSGQVRTLLATGDSLWIGSASGLSIMRITDGVPTVTRAALSGAPGWIQQPIVAIARSDSIVVIAADARVGVIDLRTRAFRMLPGNPDLSRLGHLTAVAADARTVWIGGERGVFVMDRASGLLRSANVAGMMPEIVFDIALQPEFAWLATRSGLVRLRRDADGGVR
jgi:ligand-binding sensor domain-containing protein